MNVHARLFGGLSQGLMEEVKSDVGDAGGGGGDDKDLSKARGDIMEDDDLDDKGEDKSKADDKSKGDDADDKSKGDDLDDKGEDKSKDIRIPKKEFDRRIAKEKAAREAAEKRAQEADAKLEQKSQGDVSKKLREEIDELEEQLDAAMADNNAAEKKRLRAEIRAKSDALVDARVNAQAANASALAVEQVRYDNVVARIETEYPFLNPDLDSFDEEIATELIELKQAFEAAGLASSRALVKAEKTLELRLKAKAGDKGDDKAKGDEDDKGKAKAAKVEEDRRAAAVKKGLEAKGKQPAKADDASGTVDKKVRELDVKEMSDKEFDKLSDEDKARLRGDTV